MVLSSRTNGGGGGGAQAISFRVRKTIQSIREIVGDHSDADIYAVLRESNMDPNETAQRLLNQDPFHEVRRRRDKKENTDLNGFSDVSIQRENRIQIAKPQMPLNRNVRRGIVQEFRIVKDNRVNQNAVKDSDSESVSLQNQACIKEQIISDSPDKSSIGKLIDQKHSVAGNAETQMATQILNSQSDSSLNHAKDIKSCSDHQPILPEGTHWRVSSPTKLEQKRAQIKVLSATSLASNAMVGLCSSSSDPVHVPSPDRSAGTIGAIRREVGVVGIRKQSADRSSASTSASKDSLLISVTAKENASSAEQAATSKNSRYSQSLSSNSRLYSSSQYNVKLHQQSLGHQKAGQPTMEWKPKSSQNPSNGNRGVSETAPSPPVNVGSCVGSNQVELADLSGKLSQIRILDHEHVIIPEHLRVPETERAHLIFGTFEAGLVSMKDISCDMQTIGSLKEPKDQYSASTSASTSAGSSEKVSASDQTDLMDSQVRASRSDSPASNAESVQPLSENKESMHPEEVSNYQQISMASNHASSYGLPDTQLLQDSPSLESFKAYSPHTRYGMSFLHTGVEDNVREQDLTLASEAMSLLPTNGIHFSNTMELQQQSVQQQQQPVAQMYPQVHMTHFPNFMQYRQVFSPVYIPPVAMQNYSSNAAYPQTPNGSSYLLMPGGSAPLNTGSMKYATSSYKPVPASSAIGFGNYSNPTGYSISSGTARSNTCLEDANGFKYKDSSFYIPNPQAEASDIWIQTPRELPSMQPTPFYNLPAQAGAHAAYVPTHQGHASFDAAGQAPHVQYQGMYHSAQPAPMTSIPSPHHLIHQQVPPGLGGNVGLGMVATPGAQIGAFQRNQLGHLGWTGNF